MIQGRSLMIRGLSALLLAICMMGGSPSVSAQVAQGPDPSPGPVPSAAAAPEPCAVLAETFNPEKHPEASIKNNWVLGPITQRRGTVEILLFRYRRDAPVEGADVGPLSVHIRASYGEGDVDEPPAFRWETRWRGTKGMPDDFGKLTSWIGDRIDSTPKAFHRIFADTNASPERIRCFEGFPGTTIHSEKKDRPGSEKKLPTYLTLAVLLGAILLILYAVTPCWSYITSLRNYRYAFLAVLLISAGAALLRFVAAQAGVYHENHHGFMYLESIAQDRSTIFKDFHSSFLIFSHETLNLLDEPAYRVFSLNALLSSCSPALLGLLFLLLTGNPWIGLTSAVMWALSPVAIRIAPTESIANFSLFFFLLGSTCSIAAFHLKDSLPKSLRLALMGAAILCLAQSAQGRILTLAYPAIAMALTLAYLGRPGLKELSSLAWFALLLLLTLSPWYLTLFGVLGQGNEKAPLGWICLAQNFSFESGLLFKSKVISPTLLPLAALGLFGWSRDAWSRTWLCSSVLAAFILTTIVCGDTISQTRFQLLPLSIATGLSAMGAVKLGDLLAQRHRASGAVFVLFCALSPLMSLDHLQRPMQGQLEYSFITEEVIPQLNAVEGKKILFTPSAEIPVMPIPRSWWIRQLEDTKVYRNPGDSSETKGIRFIYAGLGCFWRDGLEDDNNPAPMHGECSSPLRREDWELVTKRTIPAEAHRGGLMQFPGASINIGLYRAKSEKKPIPAK